MVIHFVYIAFSLVLLTLGAEALVRGASSLALRMGLSSFFIGLTIVGFGTSTPELATSLGAAAAGLADVNVGNVVGSNIFNVAVILATAALIAPIPVNARVVRGEVWLMIAVAFVPYGAMLTGNVLTRGQGLLMLAGIVAYVVRGYFAGRKETAAAQDTLTAELAIETGAAKAKGQPVLSVGLILAGLALLVLGARVLVTHAVDIAESVGVSELTISLTIVAAGTSMPELFTSVVAALRKQSDIAIGNVLGSNIFNVLGISGLTAAIYPQTVNAQVLWLDAPVMIAASVACLPIMMTQARVSRAEGVALLAGYAAYIYVLLSWAPRWFGA